MHNKNIISCIALDSALEEKNSLNVQNICLEVLEMHFNMNFKHIFYLFIELPNQDNNKHMAVYKWPFM